MTNKFGPVEKFKVTWIDWDRQRVNPVTVWQVML